MKRPFRICYILLAFVLLSCEEEKPRDEVFDLFQAELTKNKLKIDSIMVDGRYVVDLGENEIYVSLDNLRRNFLLNKDTTEISNFVLSLMRTMDETPSWEESKDSVYFSFFDKDNDFLKALHEEYSPELHRIFILSRNNNNEWITTDMLAQWNISQEELTKQAILNSDKLLENTEIAYDTLEGKLLGHFETIDATLKPSLIFSNDLKKRVLKDFGWPIYIVIPTRDFSLFFSEKNFKFFSDRLGTTVLREFNNSGYPLTKEVIKITDKGHEAAGMIEEQSSAR